MSAATSTACAGELAAIVGGEHVCADPAVLRKYAIDDVIPHASARPGSAAEVAAILRFCCARELVLAPAGGFTHQGTGRPLERVDVLLRLDRLNQVEHYDPGDLTIGAGAGITLGEVATTVGEHRQMFPCDPPHAGAVTLGGAMATAAHGPLKHGFGGLRDYCIGVRFVTADGKIAKAGGRVVKNVAGFDLMKLLIGSFGTLGVIVAANFKLWPAPPQTCTYVCEFAVLDEAIRFRDQLMASPLTPMALEIASPDSFGGRNWTIAVRAGGSERVLGRYRAELGSAVNRELDGAPEEQYWREAANMVAGIEQRYPDGAVMSVNVPPESVQPAIHAALQAASAAGLKAFVTGRVAVGSLIVVFASLEASATAAIAQAVAALRRSLPSDGTAVILDCAPQLKSSTDVWGHTPTDLGAMRAVKQALDPRHILNRGRFLV